VSPLYGDSCGTLAARSRHTPNTPPASSSPERLTARVRGCDEGGSRSFPFPGVLRPIVGSLVDTQLRAASSLVLVTDPCG
jgi:hypothetical protein